ncbi:hypothetical protein GF340_00485 [Candidatus Peregrinibacteria bacterium]|nr:hypothetical protein [Candidatus Peregrinibacteria bacterium]
MAKETKFSLAEIDLESMDDLAHFNNKVNLWSKMYNPDGNYENAQLEKEPGQIYPENFEELINKIGLLPKQETDFGKIIVPRLVIEGGEWKIELGAITQSKKEDGTYEIPFKEFFAAREALSAMGHMVAFIQKARVNRKAYKHLYAMLKAIYLYVLKQTPGVEIPKSVKQMKVSGIANVIRMAEVDVLSSLRFKIAQEVIDQLYVTYLKECEENDKEPIDKDRILTLLSPNHREIEKTPDDVFVYKKFVFLVDEYIENEMIKEIKEHFLASVSKMVDSADVRESIPAYVAERVGTVEYEQDSGGLKDAQKGFKSAVDDVFADLNGDEEESVSEATGEGGEGEVSVENVEPVSGNVMTEIINEVDAIILSIDSAEVRLAVNNEARFLGLLDEIYKRAQLLNLTFDEFGFEKIDDFELAMLIDLVSLPMDESMRTRQVDTIMDTLETRKVPNESEWRSKLSKRIKLFKKGMDLLIRANNSERDILDSTVLANFKAIFLRKKTFEDCKNFSVANKKATVGRLVEAGRKAHLTKIKG